MDNDLHCFAYSNGIYYLFFHHAGMEIIGEVIIT